MSWQWINFAQEASGTGWQWINFAKKKDQTGTKARSFCASMYIYAFRYKRNCTQIDLLVYNFTQLDLLTSFFAYYA
ncbi:MAG: hypothetical protein DCF15_06005 [Phormidesmis priestleyi]|uniref:Uncharacterized protein n=1 Tax=Phormidesmis priestleyi TaxID=268141 RepID=A0A2W4XPW5_9CYAN|nr:MAG: hypothetical protein DCF15_06005 [Phormidesmis priestleyi]